MKEIEEITSDSVKEISFGDSLSAYPMSAFNIIYAFIFSLFVTALFGFHTFLIKDYKTTQERLKRDKG